jgi:hypothetical protein
LIWDQWALLLSVLLLTLRMLSWVPMIPALQQSTGEKETLSMLSEINRSVDPATPFPPYLPLNQPMPSKLEDSTNSQNNTSWIALLTIMVAMEDGKPLLVHSCKSTALFFGVSTLTLTQLAHVATASLARYSICKKGATPKWTRAGRHLRRHFAYSLSTCHSMWRETISTITHRV